MGEEKEKKRKKTSSSGGEPAPGPAAQDMKAGELLRHARVQKGMELEEVSSAIHVRVAQLRAIEEGNIESLPGMTYALGFVKSYASFLKLDPSQVANQFKSEHGMTPAKPDLKFPEPIPESKMPDPMMMGAAIVSILVLLAGWVLFSDNEERSVSVATRIPPPPSDIAPITAGTAAATAPIPTVSSPPPVEAAATVAGKAVPAAPVPAAAGEDVPASVATSAAVPLPAPAPISAPDKTEGKPGIAAAPVRPVSVPVAQAPQPDSQDVINVGRGRSRIVLRATEPSWVQITDARGNVVLKKVLQTGDRYYVPDEAGYSLLTTNAGGLDVTVDGKTAQPLGRRGEIVRGVRLDPGRLQQKNARVKVHD